MDIIFVCDGSGSVGKNNFDLLLAMVKNVVNSFEIDGQDKTRVAFIQFSSSPKKEFDFTEYSDKQSIIDAVDDVKYMTGSTNTADAIKAAAQLFSDKGRKRVEEAATHTMVVISDGRSNNKGNTKTEAERARDAGINVIAVGVGDEKNLDEEELSDIAGSCNRYYHLKTFTAATAFADTLKQESCKGTVLLH